MTLLLSVVIPTHRRPRQVKRAIASAIDVYAKVDFEILVIPNGDDDTWQAVAEQYRHDPRIRWLYLPTGNASAARNHGLANARGEYLRFLDDDDYLLPAAADQLRLIEDGRLDVCSAPLETTSSEGRGVGIVHLPETDDFVAVAMRSIGIGLTQGSIFRKDFIQANRWREDIDLYDDYFWMLDVAASTEAAWKQTSIPVCAYVQHHGERLSRIKRSGRNSRTLVNALLGVHQQLKMQDRLTPDRSTAVAASLLTHAHSAFPASPCFLASTIRQASAMDPGAKPLQAIFKACPWLAKHLLLAEWAMLPARYLTRSFRRATWFAGKLLQRPNK